MLIDEALKFADKAPGLAEWLYKQQALGHTAFSSGTARYTFKWKCFGWGGWQVKGYKFQPWFGAN